MIELMKYLRLLLLLLLITACGASKNGIKKSKTKEFDTKAVKLEKEIPYEIKEDVAVKNINWKTTQKDSIINIVSDAPKNLHSNWTSILQSNVSDKGAVDYANIKKQRDNLNKYIKSLTAYLPAETWSKKEKLAYWINAYNALTVDLIIRNYPVKSIKDIKNPWKQRLWKLGDKTYSLEEIEHDILRKMNEPRIHFAIVCASYSCPKLQNKAFIAEDLETQLTTATKEFLADKNRNEISENSIELSKIFSWFSKDFTENGTLIEFLNQYSMVQISPKAKKRFKDYNWALNE